uniref:Uncharacterized protein n=1 Tax=Arundo donax TaxID=35708 RepID=A0A0A9GIP5_ARUDO
MRLQIFYSNKSFRCLYYCNTDTCVDSAKNKNGHTDYYSESD